nr:MAG TPA: hypothetical protein [Caudoviricetes sp.]
MHRIGSCSTIISQSKTTRSSTIWIIAFPAFISLLCISMYHNTVILH